LIDVPRSDLFSLLERNERGCLVLILRERSAEAVVLSRISALWLVALVLLPFTAPFPTCDIVDFFGRGAPYHGVPLAPPTSSRALIADAEWSLLVPPLPRVARQLRQVALSDLDTTHFAITWPLVILVPPVGSDGIDTAPPPSTTLRL
jgi:hypothetical protein